MAGQAFSLGAVLHGPIHKLRRTHAGIAYLKQTGQFREYMQTFIDSKNKPFISWDGEGWSDVDGEHRYMLLQSSTGAYIDAPRLTSLQCLEMLLKVAGENPGVNHVIYGGGYDATHILRDLPLELIAQLKDNNKIKWFVEESATTRQNYFTINYLPHKWLEISGFDWNKRRQQHIKIFDVMTFFQSSFIKALDSRHIAVPDIIRSGKASRADFTYNDIDEIREYCQQELELLVILCNKLRGEFDEAGIWVTQFHGPGAVASALFKEHDIRKAMQAPTPEIERAAQHAYFGGHFEQYQAGHYEGPVWLYDINSAYPYHIQQLPTMAGAKWEYTTKYDPTVMGMWFCSYEDDSNDYIKPHPLPWRGKGGIVGFPAHNIGVWVWHPEAKFATTVHHGWVLTPANDSKPFEWVGEMYTRRRQWQREGRGGERALKLGLNSLYGKTCQRVGGNEKYGGRPQWHQLEWGGLVTSSTRAQLMDAVRLAPDKIIAVETDSIMSTVPLDLNIGTGLGQWGLTKYDWVTYVQSGIYFTSGESPASTKSKTRGIDVAQLKHEEILKYLDSDQTEPLLVNSRMFIGLTNPRTYFYGQWQDSVKEVKVAGAKRVHVTPNCEACNRGESMATHMHKLSAALHYGITESAPHPLPWIDGGVIAETPEMMKADEAIEEYDVERRHK